MNFDQYDDPRPEQVELARAARMLVSALYDENGKAKDLTDRAGREALIRAISGIPREIPANLNESDRKLLNDSIAEMKKTQGVIKEWFWWVVGTMIIASIVISSGIVVLLR